MRPPASILEPMHDIHLKIPVIAMDGAVLYDTEKKRYLKKIPMTIEEKNMVMEIFKKHAIHNFANIVIDDTLLIYYGEFQNEIQARLVNELLKRELGVDKTITFGTISHAYDHVVDEGNTNQVVHKIKKLFEG